MNKKNNIEKTLVKELKNGELVNGLIVKTGQFLDLKIEKYHSELFAINIRGEIIRNIIFYSEKEITYFSELSDLKIYDNNDRFAKPMVFKVYLGDKNKLIEV